MGDLSINSKEDRSKRRTVAQIIKSSTDYVEPIQKQGGSKIQPVKVASQASTTVDTPLQKLPHDCFARSSSLFVGKPIELTKVDPKLIRLILQEPKIARLAFDQWKTLEYMDMA